MPTERGAVPIPYNQASLSSAVYGGPDAAIPLKVGSTPPKRTSSFRVRPRSANPIRNKKQTPTPPAGPRSSSSAAAAASSPSRRASVIKPHAEATSHPPLVPPPPGVTADADLSSESKTTGSRPRVGCAFASFGGSCPKLSDFQTRVGPDSAAVKLMGYIQANPGQTCGELLGRMLECPARVVLEDTETNGPHHGWIDGHLSRQAGFLPKDMSHLGQLQKRPGPSEWHTLAKRMPGLLSRYKFRETCRQIPVHSANESVLPEICLHEAASALGLIAYSFRFEQRCTDDPDATEDIPPGIMIPWTQVSKRLGRLDCFLGFQDTVCLNANWKDVTRAAGNLWSLDNTQMYYPVYRTRTEHVFFMVMIDMLEKFTPAVEAMVTAQEAVLACDNDALLKALLVVKSAVDEQVHVFHKISVNQTVEAMYCDPVQWAKTVAKHGSPWKKGVPGMSGLTSPMFHALDTFLGRTDYTSALGVEALHLREWMPPAHQKFMKALAAISVGDYCFQSGQSELKGLFGGLLQAYAGERGFLGTHRYKVYGFLELAFKTGRTETNGDTMTADDRGWEAVHDSLSASRFERLHRWTTADEAAEAGCPVRGSFRECPFAATIKSRQAITDEKDATTRKVTIDLKNTGITYMPGDRLAVLPANLPTDIASVLATLGLPGSTEIVLSGEWTVLFQPRATATVEELLKSARLRPLPRHTCNELAKLCTRAPAYFAAKKELLGMLEESDHVIEIDCTVAELVVLKQMPVAAQLPYDPSLMCNVFQPERPRTYSISSAAPADLTLPETVDLTVSRQQRKLTRGETVIGTSSGFLNPPLDAAADVHPDGSSVRVGISRPLLFSLPEATKPIVMFAGGSGIGPFMSFLQKRSSDPLSGENYLFFGVRDRKSIIYKKELVEFVKQKKLHLHIAFSREDLRIDGTEGDDFKYVKSNRCYVDALMKRAIISDQLWQLMLTTDMGGCEATFYLCGQVNLFQTVMSALEAITEENRVDKSELLRAMFAHHRFQSEVYKTPVMLINPVEITNSELAKHNSIDNGFWMAISNKVFDVTEFMDLHPGGMAIIRSNCGIDGTHVFEQVAHHTNAEILSLLDCYVIGVTAAVTFETPQVEHMYYSLGSFLTRIVEMENTFQLDAASMSQTHFSDSRELVDTSHLVNMLDLHRRALLTMAPAVGGQELRLLMSEALGLLTERADAKLPQDTFDTLLDSHDGRSALHSLHTFKYLQSNKRKNTIHNRAQVNTFIMQLLEVDQVFLRSVKTTVAGALAELEVSPTGAQLQDAVADILEQLTSVIAIIRILFQTTRSTLARRYLVPAKSSTGGKRSPAQLWQQLKNRVDEKCLQLLGMDPGRVQSKWKWVAAQVPPINHLQADAVNIARHLAATKPPTDLGAAGGNPPGILAAAFKQTPNAHAHDKQLARIMSSMERLKGPSTEGDWSSTADRAVSIELLRGLFTSLMSFGADSETAASRADARGGDNSGGNSDTDTAVQFTVYTVAKCGYSSAAVNLLRSEGVNLQTIDVSTDAQLKAKLVARAKHRCFPQIYVGKRFVGGFAELRSIHSAGLLHSMEDHDHDQAGAGLSAAAQYGIARDLTKSDIRQALAKHDLPAVASDALHFFNDLLDLEKSATGISFEVFCLAWLQAGELNKETSKETGLMQTIRRKVAEVKPNKAAGMQSSDAANEFKLISQSPTKVLSALTGNGPNSASAGVAGSGSSPSLGTPGSSAMILYVKCWTGKIEKTLGDCPFSHAAHMALVEVGAKYHTIVIDLDNKPDWFAAISPDNTVPVLGHRGKAIPDSGNILNYLETAANFELPGLDCSDCDLQLPLLETTDAAVGAFAGCFKAFAIMMENNDDSKQPEIAAALTKKLACLDAHCKDSGPESPFLCGKRISAIDCKCLPLLYHIDIAGETLKGYTIPDELEHLHTYKKYGFATKAFKISSYPADAVLDGWMMHMSCAVE